MEWKFGRRISKIKQIIIQDFSLLSKVQSEPTGNDGTSLIFSVKHVPGALYSILAEFASRGINLTKIESRPTKEIPWEYYFYVDFDGHRNDKQIKDLIRILREENNVYQNIGLL